MVWYIIGCIVFTTWLNALLITSATLSNHKARQCQTRSTQQHKMSRQEEVNANFHEKSHARSRCSHLWVPCRYVSEPRDDYQAMNCSSQGWPRVKSGKRDVTPILLAVWPQDAMSVQLWFQLPLTCTDCRKGWSFITVSVGLRLNSKRWLLSRWQLAGNRVRGCKMLPSLCILRWGLRPSHISEECPRYWVNKQTSHPEWGP